MGGKYSSDIVEYPQVPSTRRALNSKKAGKSDNRIAAWPIS